MNDNRVSQNTEAPLSTITEYDPLLYQQALLKALDRINNVLRRRDMDPLRYIVQIDPGLPAFERRETHHLRIGYNRHDILSTETAIPHKWLLEQAGPNCDAFLAAVDDLALELKGRVRTAGRPV
ncbi:MAG: hypothetical protein ACREUQ_03190 [Burkholderiales bacterium]